MMEVFVASAFFVGSAFFTLFGAKVVGAKSVKNVTFHEPVVEQRNVVVVSRIHGSAGKLVAPEKIISFARSCQDYADLILLAVDLGHSFENMEYINNLNKIFRGDKLASKLQILPVNPWGNFIFSLNAAVQKAVEMRFKFILFQSIELTSTKETVQIMLALMSDPNTLVVGPALPGHEFIEGTNVLRGRTCPWNTLAVWSVKELAKVGFPMIGDGVDTKFGGVEEVSAISMAQHFNSKLRAVLLLTNGFEWKTTFADPKRQQYHDEKMRSKDERPAAQLAALGLEAGTVVHIRGDDSTSTQEKVVAL